MPANFDLSYYYCENNRLFCISKRFRKALDQRPSALPTILRFGAFLLLFLHIYDMI